MVDLKFLLSPRESVRGEQYRREIMRCYGLESPWLAIHILNTARNARLSVPHLGNPCNQTYSTSLVWDVAPSIAARLAPSLVKLQTNEARDYGKIPEDNHFRSAVASTIIKGGSSLFNLSFKHEYECGWLPLRLLGTTPVNGNLLAIGLDRVAPPEHSRDEIAEDMRIISFRRGLHASPRWTPEMFARPGGDGPAEDNPGEIVPFPAS